MTVVAWDGVTLSADRRMVSGQAVQSTTKIIRFGQQLLAITGNLSVGVEVRAWYMDGAHRADYPASNRKLDEGASLIVVNPDREVWKYESSPVPFIVNDPFCAFGSGQECALVALACGKTAREAVELACRFNAYCGNGIDTLELLC